MINDINIAMPILNIAGLIISNPNRIVAKARMNSKAFKIIVFAKSNSGLININIADRIINIEKNNSYFEDLDVKNPFTKLTIIRTTIKTINSILTKKYDWKLRLAN